MWHFSLLQFIFKNTKTDISYLFILKDFKLRSIFMAILCLQNSVGSSDRVDCFGFVRCSFPLPLSPCPPHSSSLQTILACTCTFYSFNSDIFPISLPPLESLVQNLCIALHPLKETNWKTIFFNHQIAVFYFLSFVLRKFSYQHDFLSTLAT